LARAASEPAVSYEYRDQTFSIDDYLARNPTTGLLVARGDTILIERYQYARHDRHRFTSWSLAKTVTAKFVWIAIAEGRIRSVDDPAATWLIDRSGQEVTFCCLKAVLRDYARMGLLLAHNGNWRGRQIIPAAWIEDATRLRPDQPHLHPPTITRSLGYGYQVWIFAGERRMFLLLGIHGQAIYVDPASRLVMVHTAVRKQARDPSLGETNALWRSLVQQLGH
jgi:CubicO group peptidase (beta-lactamase class C family)